MTTFPFNSPFFSPPAPSHLFFSLPAYGSWFCLCLWLTPFPFHPPAPDNVLLLTLLFFCRTMSSFVCLLALLLFSLFSSANPHGRLPYLCHSFLSTAGGVLVLCLSIFGLLLCALRIRCFRSFCSGAGAFSVLLFSGRICFWFRCFPTSDSANVIWQFGFLAPLSLYVWAIFLFEFRYLLPSSVEGISNLTWRGSDSSSSPFLFFFLF